MRPKPWGYAGEYLEPASGLIYLRARWYDPVDGRFLTRDPFAGIPSVPGTLNPYAYALDNPVMVTDPSGQVVPLLALIALGLAGGALGGVGYYGIESAANADPCTGMEWDWNQAAFWGTIGMPIGAVVAAAGYPALTSALGMTLSEALGLEAAAASTVWSLPWWLRGQVIEDMLGRSSWLVRNFPGIDRFENGIATSIKSIDLRAGSYQDMGALTSKVKGYVDAMAAYQGQPYAWGGTTIKSTEIMGRAVDLAVPAGAVTNAQLTAQAQM